MIYLFIETTRAMEKAMLCIVVRDYDGDSARGKGLIPT